MGDDMTSAVYVLADERDRIIRVDADWNIANKTGWTEIDKGSGDRYYLAQSNYFEGGLTDDAGVPVYKLVSGKAVKRTAEEIEADGAAMLPQDSPTLEEQLAAMTMKQAEQDARLLELQQINAMLLLQQAQAGGEAGV